MRRKLRLKEITSCHRQVSLYKLLIFHNTQSSKTFVSKENKFSPGHISYHSGSVDVPLDAAPGGKVFSPGNNKRVNNSLWYSSGTQKEKKKSKSGT